MSRVATLVRLRKIRNATEPIRPLVEQRLDELVIDGVIRLWHVR